MDSNDNFRINIKKRGDVSSAPLDCVFTLLYQQTIPRATSFSTENKPETSAFISPRDPTSSVKQTNSERCNT